MMNDFDASKVLRTVLDISLGILMKDKIASFAFVGVYKIEKEDNLTPRTQRYRIYKRISEYFLGGQTFIHTYEERSNSYLLINKLNPNPTALSEDVINMFANVFQGIDHI